MTKTEQSAYRFQEMHEEHVAVLDKLTQLTQAIGAPRTAQDSTLPRYRDLLRALIDDLEGLVEDHFRFEERYLFPLLREAGKRALADSLALEHIALRHAALPVLDHVRKALAASPSEKDWDEFKRQATVLIELKRAHVRREETELVPVLKAVMAVDKARFPLRHPQAAL